MKFSVDVKALQVVLKKTKAFIGTIHSTPYLHIQATQKDGIDVVATDLDRRLTTKLGGHVESDGDALVSWALLNKFITSLKTGVVEVEIVDGKVSFTCGNRNRTIKTDFKVEDFPRQDIDYDGQPVNDLVRADKLDAVIESAATDESRPILTGVLFRGNMVATDSYRLVVVKDACPDLGFDVLVPTKFLKVLKQFVKDPVLHYTVSVDNKWIMFEDGPDVYEGRLIDGDFPNYKSLVPTDLGEHDKLVVDRVEFTDALKVMCNSGLAGTKAKPGPGSHIKVEGDGTISINYDDVKESVTVQVKDGSSWSETIGYNPWFMLSIVKHTTAIYVTVNGMGMKPTVIEDDDITFLIMPVRSVD